MIRFEKLAELEGLIPWKIGVRLLMLARHVPRELAIVEIGSYRGKSACYLAEGARNGCGAHVWCVDPWDTDGNEDGRFGFAQQTTRDAFTAQVTSMGLAERITPVQLFSHEAAEIWTDPPIGLLYIDGSHAYEDVRRDWELWSKNLAPEAIVVFDDYRTERNPGVERFVDELREQRPDWTWKLEDRLAVVYVVQR